MPKTLDTKQVGSLTEEISVTAIHISLPINGDIALRASLTKTIKAENGEILLTTQVPTPVDLSNNEVIAIPIFPQAYVQLRDALYAKYDAITNPAPLPLDPEPTPEPAPEPAP